MMLYKKHKYERRKGKIPDIIIDIVDFVITFFQLIFSLFRRLFDWPLHKIMVYCLVRRWYYEVW